MVLSLSDMFMLLFMCSLRSVGAVPHLRQNRHEFLGALTSDCRFILGDREYDLCPVVRGPAIDLVYGRSDAFSSALTTYKFNLGGSIISEDQNEACNQDTWICMIDHPIGSASVKVPLTENVHQTNNEPYAIAKHEESDHASFTMTFSGRPPRPTTQIRFMCDSNSQTSDLSVPSFVQNDDEIHIFTWTTAHACGRELDPPRHVIAFESNTSEYLEDGNEHQDLRNPASIPDRPKSFTKTIILLTGFAIIALAYLVHSPPAYLQRLTHTRLQPSWLHSRISQGSPIHSHGKDDMVMFEHEVDIMVNANELEWGAIEEEIPLKSSPKRSSFFPKYGST